MIHKRIKADNGEYYYVPIDVINPADHLHITDTNPDRRMRGYGGSVISFIMEDGRIELVKGPWHTNSMGFVKHTGMNIGELHLTRVTLIQDGEVIYEEKEPVLGPFYRGERIAQQLARLRGVPILFRSESAGGSSSKTCLPDDKYNHPLSMRKEDKDAT